jgi:hypothetical protein
MQHEQDALQTPTVVPRQTSGMAKPTRSHWQKRLDPPPQVI